MYKLSNYDYKYFTGNPGSREQRFWDCGQIRYGDQLAAIGYALGIEKYEGIQYVLSFENGEELIEDFEPHNALDLLFHYATRTPKRILDIGGGRGEVALGLSYLDIETIMLEPAAGAEKLLEETAQKLEIENNVELFGGLLENLKDYDFDTAIFCESIEHIPEEEIRTFFSKFKGRVIITNWIDFHPLEPDGVWHITRIDDAFYASLPGKVVYQEGSHLILEV